MKTPRTMEPATMKGPLLKQARMLRRPGKVFYPLLGILCSCALPFMGGDTALGADYQYISSTDRQWWTTNNLAWTQTGSWDGTPPVGGPTENDNLDLKSGFLIQIIGESGGSGPFSASIHNITVSENDGLVARIGSHNGWKSTLNVFGNIEIASQQALRLYDRNSSSELNVNVAEDIAVSQDGTLFLGILADGTNYATGGNNRLTSISVAGRTKVDGLLQNAASNQVGSSSIFLGDLEVNGTLVVAAVEEGSATYGSATNEISLRSLSGSGAVFGSNISGTGTRSTTLKIQTEAGSTGDFAGALVDSKVATSGTTRLDIIISGAGRQSFSGNNTYTGQTLVSSGTLLVNGTHIQATPGQGGGASSGLYLVEDGGTLGGSGRIAGNITGDNSHLVYVEAGGILAPGAGEQMAALTLDGELLSGTGNVTLKMDPGAAFSFRLAGDGSEADRLTFWNYSEENSMVLSSNQVSLTLAGPLIAGTYTVTLFDFFSDSGETPTPGNLTSGLVLSPLSPGSNISHATLIYNSHNIALEYTVVPEPEAMALGLCFILSVAVFRRFVWQPLKE